MDFGGRVLADDGLGGTADGRRSSENRKLGELSPECETDRFDDFSGLYDRGVFL